MSCSLFLAVVSLGLVTAVDLTPYRLPGDVIPYHYELKILTDLDNFIFSGEVDIEIKCETATDTIKLHSVSLAISEVALTQISDNNKVDLKGTVLDTDNEFLIVYAAKPLAAGSSYRLHIPFSGELTNQLAGYYRSKYEDKSSNTTKWVAVTQFEPTDARRAFPCFDEPDMKAKFSIQLGHRHGLKSASNMPILNTREDVSRPGWVWDEYQESVPMSTYLVAFMVSEFESAVSDPEPNKVLFRTWARKDAINQAEFVRKYGPKFLSFYEDFFGIPYPLPKQDMLAIPDFFSGAMENWGLITYRESSLLLDESTADMSIRYRISETCAHELAHQWFGNLVTMKWWCDLWLNEGFANYVSSLAVHHQFPDWNAYNFAVAEQLLDVFKLDALQTSHPVSVTIGNPSEINQIFDDICYGKGSLLLHMMHCFLGDKVFQTGVSNYLKKYSYKNAEQDDLWEQLSAEAEKTAGLPSGVTVKHIMDMWTLQSGYPVLTVKREGGTVTVSQKHFLAVRPKSAEPEEQCWWVPITYSTAKTINFEETRSSHWLSCELRELSFDTGAGPDDWIMLNNKVAGIYRVNYDPHTWTLLADALNGPDFAVIHELNRLQLVADALALARVGDLEYSTAFRVLKYIRQETAYTPWSAAFPGLDNIKNLLWRTEKYSQFKALVQSLLGPIYGKLSDFRSVPKGMEESRLKQRVIRWACEYEIEDCTHKAADLFKSWMSSGTNTILKELREIVYCQGVKQGGEAEWQFVWEQYQTSNVATEKVTFLRALACTRKEVLLDRYLKWSIDSSSGVRRQDACTVFLNIALKSEAGYNLALSFLENNIQQIHDYLAPNTLELGDYLKYLAAIMVFPEEVEKLKKFMADNANLLQTAQLSANQGLEAAEGNLIWMSKFYPTICDSFLV